MLVSDLLECCSFQIDDNLDLIDFLWLICLLTSFKSIPPCDFHFFYDPLGNIFWVRALKKFHELKLTCIDNQNGSTLFVCFMEADWHKLSDSVLFAHEVVL